MLSGSNTTTVSSHFTDTCVRVRKGQRVARGEQLGLVGLSGDTQVPHIHFEVKRDGKIVDPFTGLNPSAGCGDQSGVPLWHPETFTLMP
tara:strand:+ start:5356 stop:5622 length:267 start_codon:yes stop_codon:yes gene_type:complete